MSTCPDSDSTAGRGYTERLLRVGGSRWKRLVPVQAPYRWNLRRLDLGYTLDIGCGLGRNLAHLDGNGVGIDHNPDSVSVARERGLTAFTPAEFLESSFATATFDSLLFAHVLEHMTAAAAEELVATYLPRLAAGGRVVFVTPQERGYATDATHVTFVDFDGLDRLCSELHLEPVRRYSFPFPRWAGPAFPYNEFVYVARSAGRASSRRATHQ